MLKNRWYNKAMSKLTTIKENIVVESDFETPNENRQVQPRPKEINSELDISLVIASFQEKVGQLTTELIIKDATIKQLTAIINTLRGNQQ